jgi:ssDNA-binding Zn-finger/Zn-ribbon topoisomerase 1
MMEFYSFGTPKPTPPPSRLIREGTVGDCLMCGSTTVKRFIWFGRKIGCINPDCPNYYKRFEDDRKTNTRKSYS